MEYGRCERVRGWRFAPDVGRGRGGDGEFGRERGWRLPVTVGKSVTGHCSSVIYSWRLSDR